MARQTTEEWIVEVRNDDQKGDCYVIALVHYVGQEPNEVDRVAFPCNMTNRQIADRFDSRIRERVHDLPGQQMCALLAFYGTSSEPGASRPFSLTGRLSHPGVTSEPPTNTGVLQQVMRQNELIHQTLAEGMREVVNGFKELAKSALDREALATSEIEKLRDENAHAWVIVRNLGVQQQKENIDHEIKLRKEERTNHLIERLSKWGPALINTIAGKEVFPQATHDTAIIEGLLSEMQPEHIQLLSGLVPPSVMGLISSRAQQMFAERDAKMKAQVEAKRLEEGLNPEGELQ